ncbi:MAG: DUF6503 family protein [Cytophagales bacterium]|nr:DUF6503 family protein [Cytophagales bacterium]
MKTFTRIGLLASAFLITLTSLAQTPDPKELLQQMEAKVGGWDKLWSQKDVEFLYNYVYADGKKDVSTERYIFEGEHSWAKYTQHDINVMPGKGGVVIQSLVDNKPACVMDGSAMDDPQVLGGTDFLRRANYFWFAMFYKMLNPGTIHKYMGSEEVDGVNYHKISVAYESETTGKLQNDAYVLYLNPETMLVDHFFFSLPAMGVNQPVLKMKVEYEAINGLLLPTKRWAFQPGADGKPSAEPFLTQISSQVKFNNGFTPEDLKI